MPSTPLGLSNGAGGCGDWASGTGGAARAKSEEWRQLWRPANSLDSLPSHQDTPPTQTAKFKYETFD